MMKSLTLTAVILSTIVLAGCTLPWSTNTPDTMMKDDAMVWQTDSNTATQEQMDDTINNDIMVKDDTSMTEQEIEKQNDTMIKNDDIMINNDDVMMDDNAQDTITQSAWSYETYSASAVTSALSAGKSVVLFFHASRCPPCRALEAQINANTLPDNTVVFKVDYDNSTDLKKQYGVTTQHTLVRIGSDWSMVSKNIGGTFTDLVKLF